MPARRKIYEHNETTRAVDVNTGELMQESTTTYSVAYGEQEPDYIKVYMGCILRFNNLSESLNPILIALCKHMQYAPGDQVVYVNAYTKKAIAEDAGIGIKRVEQAIRKFDASGIIKRIQRGVYMVNPNIIGRGTWQDIKTLRAKFDFITGEIETEYETKSPIKKEK